MLGEFPVVVRGLSLEKLATSPPFFFYLFKRIRPIFPQNIELLRKAIGSLGPFPRVPGPLGGPAFRPWSDILWFDNGRLLNYNITNKLIQS